MSALVCFPIVLLLWPGAGAVQAEAPATAAAPTWVRLTEHAAFSPRDTADEVIFQGKMWLSNGYYHGAKLSRDLWCTTDGQQWTLVNSSTPYDGYSQLVAYKDRLWAIKKSVWSSTDGIAWTKVADNTPFGGGGEVVVHQDRILSLTGRDSVWSTTDGLNWTPPRLGRLRPALGHGRGAHGRQDLGPGRPDRQAQCTAGEGLSQDDHAQRRVVLARRRPVDLRHGARPLGASDVAGRPGLRRAPVGPGRLRQRPPPQPGRRVDLDRRPPLGAVARPRRPSAHGTSPVATCTTAACGWWPATPGRCSTTSGD